ncbi:MULTISPECIES: Crp/Fnr family transcriptional regulator [Afifella]|uniref:Crp/Fnr family transcriptional regulator n=1 Tax=Afifella TaxID=643217 RepID=UPI000FE2ECD2|nr:MULTISPECIES: Crp/Fnr family transcriptional regulator [Afifella]MCF1505531.1 Crp/Fnr family transcriptional regulator [Afifella sp. H1R]MCT8266884.1 Crp/Fnr family transcriptional regulator [Afifella sp. JA880]
MSMDEEVRALSRVPIFANVDVAKLKLLAFISERVVFHPGEVLCRQGEEGDTAFIILSGDCDVLVDTGQGRKKIAELGSTDIVGEIAVLFEVPRTATVVATHTTEALALSRDQMFSLLREFPDVAFDIMRVLAHRLERTTQDLAELRGRLAGEAV